MIKYKELERKSSNSVELNPDQYRELEEIIARLKNESAFPRAEAGKRGRQNDVKKGRQIEWKPQG
jgi:hypothetical protein